MIVVPVEKKVDWRRPPIVLIALVIINIWVFAFYQSNDSELMASAVEYYERNGMLDTEWRAYRAYTDGLELPYEVHKNTEFLTYYIVSDPSFDRFLAERSDQYIPKPKRERWHRLREQLEDISGRISSNAYGFHANDISVVQLFTSQFLHGGLMHLVGNLVFLVLVGFAVEAALGSGLFLLFYLISGVGGGLVFAIFAGGSTGSLIGASGAISGVMAMYVVLFGLRKIRFFYWAFIFTGYFRAAAIIMLPIYVLMEVYGIVSNEGSNVAFTAHIGGFIGGAILVYFTQKFRSQAIDENYLDNKPDLLDPNEIALQRAYDEMGRCEFSKAWESLKPIKKANPSRQDVIELEYHLVRALYPKKVNDYLIHRMGKVGNAPSLQQAQLQLWDRLDENKRLTITVTKRQNLLKAALHTRSLTSAERIFETLQTSSDDPMGLAVCARQISVHCREVDNQTAAKKYQDIAEALANSNGHLNPTRHGAAS